ncbi:LPS export ABC transporter periplasmic protein LptC [Mesorhizobium xinjiangense]|uniref:LPS export ABC transporter periplasmic protein LptC n=1 Tax=Mesorhizobium xinjiangense TaxID=2678685 RepID=UPI0038B39EED
MAAFFAGYSWLKSPPTLDIEVDGTALQDGKLVMANPTLDGFGKDDLPYSMTAARALQDLSDTSAIQLEDISARLPLSAENFATIGAKAGIYDNEKNTLEITTPLTVETDDGMSITMQSAFIDIANGELKSNEPIDIRLDGSQIEADTFRVRDRGKVFIFEDRVRMQIDPKKLRAPDGQSGGADGGN